MSTAQWSSDPLRDQGFFDGSAEPNPGGALGLGWHIIFRDGQTHEGSLREPPKPENTNNVAEYRALIALLADYRRLGGTGPLIVRGDSQLILNQVFGGWSVRAGNLRDYWEEATALVRQYAATNIQVVSAHIPRERNAKADQLASGKPPVDPATFAFALATIPDVHPTTASAIAAAVAQGKISFKQTLQLRVGGRDSRDSASALRWDALAARAGAACVAVVLQEFPAQETPDPAQVKAREAALRWCLRGLPAQLACRKVQIDLQVAANRAQGEQRRYTGR